MSFPEVVKKVSDNVKHEIRLVPCGTRNYQSLQYLTEEQQWKFENKNIDLVEIIDVNPQFVIVVDGTSYRFDILEDGRLGFGLINQTVSIAHPPRGQYDIPYVVLG